jgi:hypothetical protein
LKRTIAGLSRTILNVQALFHPKVHGYGDMEVPHPIATLNQVGGVFYKTGKSGLGLGELSSSRPHIVITRAHAVLIRVTVAMQAKRMEDEHVASNRWINPGAWVRLRPMAVDQVLDARPEPASTGDKEVIIRKESRMRDGAGRAGHSGPG